MKKSIVLFSLLMGFLTLPITIENKNMAVMGEVSEDSPSLETESKISQRLNNPPRKLNFILGGGEPGRIARKSQLKKVSPVNNSTTGILKNADHHLVTTTYEGSGQATHPSVIDFKLEYGIEKWNGYRYWMVFTPYPYSNDIYENPSLLSSNDGLTWVVPQGFEKPVNIKTDKKNFNSDPSIVYDRETNTLNVYWREVLMGHNDKILRTRISENGKIEPKVPILIVDWSDKEGLALSPTIWKKSLNEWYMWTANGSSTVHLYSSKDGLNWSKRERCSYPWLDWNGGYIPWHLEAKPNFREKRIEFFIAGFPKGKGINEMAVFYAEAPMSDPSKISMPLPSPLLTKGNSSNWDENYVYRATFTIEPEDDSYKYHVWYAAVSTLGKWQIGYTEGNIGTIYHSNSE